MPKQQIQQIYSHKLKFGLNVTQQAENIRCETKKLSKIARCKAIF